MGSNRCPFFSASSLYFIEWDTECICHTLAIGRVSFLAVRNVTDIDEFGSIARSGAHENAYATIR
jgi:hypothetical protein